MKTKTLVSIALRNVLRQRRRALLLGGAIAIGSCIAFLAEGLTGGMSRNLRNSIETSTVGNLYLTAEEWRKEGNHVRRILDDRMLLDAVTESGINPVRIVPVSRADATLVFNGKSGQTTLIGIPWTQEDPVLDSPAIEEGSLEGMQKANGIILPASLAQRLGIQAGESVLVKTSTVTGQANVAEFVVAAVASSLGGGLFESSFARLETVGSLLGLPSGGYGSLHLYAPDTTDLEVAARSILATLESNGARVKARDNKADTSGLPGGSSGPLSMMMGSGEAEEAWEGSRYSITTLNDEAGQFTSILSSIRMIAIIVFITLLIISMVGIVNTFRMTLIERTREIGTMRALGLKSRDAGRLFTLEALMIAVSGILAGFVAASIIMPLISSIRFGESGLSMFLDAGHLVFRISLQAILAYAVCTLLASWMAVTASARTAARLKPAEALRK